MTMNKYHIVFKDNIDEFFSKGKTYVASSPINAIKQFEEDLPTCIFLLMYDLSQTTQFGKLEQ